MVNKNILYANLKYVEVWGGGGTQRNEAYCGRIILAIRIIHSAERKEGGGVCLVLPGGVN